MKITDFLNVKGIKVDLEATDKEGILKELVDLLAEVKDVGDKKNILRALVERENLGSTGIGQGIAIPHGKTDKVDGLVAVLGVTAYRQAFGNAKIAVGPSADGFEGAQLWILPNPSGLNAHETAESLADWYGRAAQAAGISLIR